MFRRTTASLFAATLAVGALVVSASATAPPYVGNQYDYGGVRTPINGTVQVVDDIANSITASAAQSAAAVEATRAALPYGGIDPGAGPNQLVTYPGPPGVTASNQYAVSVQQGGAPQASFVYKSVAAKPDTNRSADTSWTSFSMRAAVTVTVTKLGGSATDCMVRPYSAGIVTAFSNNTCTFTLPSPQNVSVEFHPEIHNPVEHPMLVFANPLEADVPDPGDPNVLYLGPGYHFLGAGVPIQSNQTIYVAGGAWVDAQFIANGPVHNVTFKGRGIVSGLFNDTGDQTQNKNQPGMLDIIDPASSNVLVEGVTFVNAPRFNIRALAHHTTIHNVKVICWWFSCDGLVAGNTSVIENNFVKVNDDSIKLHWGDTVVRGNTLWQLENGGTFNLSWNIHDDVNTFHVYDNDVIHAEHYEFEKQAIFRSRHAGSGTLSRYLFEDIRIENATWRLFYLVLENNKWYEPSLGYGEIEQVIFRNIHAYTSYTHPNVVQGIDGNNKLKNINFQNVFANNECFASTMGGNFELDPWSTNAIRIMRSQDGSCWT